jgi:hypothetical protein
MRRITAYIQGYVTGYEDVDYRYKVVNISGDALEHTKRWSKEHGTPKRTAPFHSGYVAGREDREDDVKAGTLVEWDQSDGIRELQ